MNGCYKLGCMCGPLRWMNALHSKCINDYGLKAELNAWHDIFNFGNHFFFCFSLLFPLFHVQKLFIFRLGFVLPICHCSNIVFDRLWCGRVASDAGCDPLSDFSATMMTTMMCWNAILTIPMSNGVQHIWQFLHMCSNYGLAMNIHIELRSM